MDDNRIGINIAALRKRDGITQQKLAEALSISTQAVSKWERGTCLPDTQMMPAIAKFFHVSIDFLYFGKAENQMQNQTVNRDKNYHKNRFICRYFSDEVLEGLTDEEFLALQEKMKMTVTSIAGIPGRFLEFYEGLEGEKIGGDKNKKDYCIFKRINPVKELGHNFFFYMYERVFTFARLLGVKNYYDLFCREALQGAYMIYDPETTYTGIDTDLFHDYVDEFHAEPEYVNEVFESFNIGEKGRIRYIKGTYPCELEIRENNIAVNILKNFTSQYIRNNCMGDDGGILGALGRDFERMILCVETKEFNPSMKTCDVRDVISGAVPVEISTFDETYALIKELLPEFEFFRIGRGRRHNYIFGTKMPLDKVILEKEFTVSGDRITSGIIDTHWHNEMLR